MMDARLTEIIRSHLPDKSMEILEDANLKYDYGMDSLDVVEIVMEMENTYDIAIDDDDVPLIKNVRDLEKYLPEN